jgi:hypothetical protein
MLLYETFNADTLMTVMGKDRDATLQEMIDVMHFQPGTARASRSPALSRVLVIRDSSSLSSELDRLVAEKLMAQWKTYGGKLDTSIDSAHALFE